MKAQGSGRARPSVAHNAAHGHGVAPTTESFVDSREFARMTRAIEFIEREYERQPRLADIARHVGLSEFHFNRLFRRWTGLTPKQYLAEVTSRAAGRALREETSVLDAAHSVGLSGGGRLHDLTVTLEALSPGEIRARGARRRHSARRGQTRLRRGLRRGNRAGTHAPRVHRRPQRRTRNSQELRVSWPRRNSSATTRVRPSSWPHLGTDKAATLPLAVAGPISRSRYGGRCSNWNPASTVTYSALARKLGCTGQCTRRGKRGGCESGRLGHPLPSRAARGRTTRRISLGRGPQTDDSPLGRKARRGVITF